ncbi:hypothetical protein BDQ12DRAFT_670120 [Crucibulum laeve]|uniref:Hydrophobin n=1 Tax=Crucibulum laeve TaxID=68775 RepID=A0A5C3LL54_9AGAR|nr:hypothetical protein BDQ12DRAFT_670105 [Crucibulum laeve]TFK33590.1 hypothetical protein BDQ12DRAFT_670120 [Crucibulum laeve]
MKYTLLTTLCAVATVVTARESAATLCPATSKAVCCQSITTVEDNTKPVFDAAKKNAVPDAAVDFPAGLTCQPTTDFSTCKAKPVCCKTIAKGNMRFNCYRPETGFSSPKA